ncbi:MAG: nucleoside deaminase [Pirellulales bacterium]
MIQPETLMELAIEKCREGIEAGQTPFGCAIARGGDLLAVAHNTVLAATDITAHAEITALRIACRSAGDISLESAVVATTCEPCPMCMAALHWSRVEVVYYGATIADATSAGFNELSISAPELVRLGSSPVRLVPDLQTDACRALFDHWRARGDRRTY